MQVGIMHHHEVRHPDAPERGGHQQVEWRRHGAERDVGVGRAEARRQRRHLEWQDRQAHDEAGQIFVGRERELARRRGATPRSSACEESDSAASTPANPFRLPASSAAKRGPAPRRPHCQTRIFTPPPRVPGRARSPATRLATPHRRGSRAAALAERHSRRGIAGEADEMSGGFVDVGFGPHRIRRLEHATRTACRH
jgi:hypothetical protein